MNREVYASSKSSEWETPFEFFCNLDRIFHFTLDPAATTSINKSDSVSIFDANLSILSVNVRVSDNVLVNTSDRIIVSVSVSDSVSCFLLNLRIESDKVMLSVNVVPTFFCNVSVKFIVSIVIDLLIRANSVSVNVKLSVNNFIDLFCIVSITER